MCHAINVCPVHTQRCLVPCVQVVAVHIVFIGLVFLMVDEPEVYYALIADALEDVAHILICEPCLFSLFAFSMA